MQTIRLFLFALFSGIGIGALGLSILVEDLLLYFYSKDHIHQIREDLVVFHTLNEDYDDVIARLGNDPNSRRRVALLMTGQRVEHADTVYPCAHREILNMARLVLRSPYQHYWEDQGLPHWLDRCRTRRNRVLLFLCGAGLVMVSIVSFGKNPAISTS